MHQSRASASARAVDESLTIFEYFPADVSARLSVVAATLAGRHSLRKNLECDQAYFVVAGTGTAVVDGTSYDLAAGDVVFIPAKAVHELSGSLDLLIINGPAYDPAQTEVL